MTFLTLALKIDLYILILRNTVLHQRESRIKSNLFLKKEQLTLTYNFPFFHSFLLSILHNTVSFEILYTSFLFPLNRKPKTLVFGKYFGRRLCTKGG